MYSQARSGRLCWLFKCLTRVVEPDGSLIVPGPGQGTKQIDNLPWTIAQSQGWLKLSLGTVSPRDTASPSRAGVQESGRGSPGTPGDFAAGHRAQ